MFLIGNVVLKIGSLQINSMDNSVLNIGMTSNKTGDGSRDTIIFGDEKLDLPSATDESEQSEQSEQPIPVQRSDDPEEHFGEG